MKLLKSVFLCCACLITLTILGLYTINNKRRIEVEKSCYTLTNFDYSILSPSKEQVNQLRGNTEAVNSIFPCYIYNTFLTGKNKSKVCLMLSDEVDNYSIGLFNDKNKISGNYFKNGLMLDKISADSLNAKVGDKVNIELDNSTFQLEVSAIYMESHYDNLSSNGVSGFAFAMLSSDMIYSLGNDLNYNYAFIDAKDELKCREALNNYKPLGLIVSEEKYISDYKSNNTCPTGLSDEEWTESIKAAYNNYVEYYMNKEYKNCVYEKSVDYAKTIDKYDNLDKDVSKLCIIGAVVVTFVYALLSIVLVLTNKNDDKVNVKDGNNGAFKKYVYVLIVGTLLISLLTGLILTIPNISSPFFDLYKKIIFLFSIPILLSLVIIIPFIIIYKNSLISKVKEEKKEKTVNNN